MQLARVETEVPAAEAQCCCCQGDDAPTWYRLTIIDFKVPDLLRAPRKRFAQHSNVLTRCLEDGA